LDVVAFNHHGDNIPPSVYLLQLFINSSQRNIGDGIAVWHVAKVRVFS